jgi:dTDP-4-amino-4,6-dideoxygalactose transaminase
VASRRLGYHAGDLPSTEQAAREVLSIPMYAELTSAQQEWIATTVLEHVGVGNTFESNVPVS